MRRRDLDAAIPAEVGRGVVHLLGPAQAEVEHLGAASPHASSDRGEECPRGGAVVAPEDDHARAEHLGEGQPMRAAMGPSKSTPTRPRTSWALKQVRVSMQD